MILRTLRFEGGKITHTQGHTYIDISCHALYCLNFDMSITLSLSMSNNFLVLFEARGIAWGLFVYSCILEIYLLKKNLLW